MKKYFLLALMVSALSAEQPKNFCSIKDRLFVQQINDIRLNPQNYSDKIIQIEGFFAQYPGGYLVYRQTAGCCGDDGMVGFDFTYKGKRLDFKQNEWIMVEGKVAKEIIETDYVHIYLEAISVTKKAQGKLKSFVM